MKIQYVRNPVRISPTQINLRIKINGRPAMDFTADANDVEEHGRRLYADAVSGKYGPVENP